MPVIMKIKHWTEEEDNYIKDNYFEKSDEELGVTLDRTARAVRNERVKLGFVRSNRTRGSSELKQTRKPVVYEEIKQEMESKGYIVLSKEDECKNTASKIRYICKRHEDKGEQSITVGHIREGKGCVYCGRERMIAKTSEDVNEEEDRKLCEIKGFEYVESRKENGKFYIYFICPNHRELGVQRMAKGNMNRESVHGCQYCIGRNLPHWYVKQQIEECYPYYVVKSEFQGMNKPLDCYCKEHDVEFTALAKDILYNGRGCKQCMHERFSANCRLKPDEIERTILEKNPNVDILNIDSYLCVDSLMELRCKNCGTVWKQSFASIQVNTCRCPSCQRKYPIGEQLIIDRLSEININYEHIYKFDDCIYKQKLSYDFAILDDKNNVLGLIEFQGRQHYEPIEYFGGQEQFEYQQMRDRIKREYCKTNSIPLLEIPYYKQDNINQILDDFINEITK